MPKIKKAKRYVLKTILVYCEWDNECAFFAYLKDMYHQRGAGFSIDFQNGHGWSPDVIVNKARQSEGYDDKYVWMDTDRPEVEQGRMIAETNGIPFFENNPLCLEWEILRMLGHKMAWILDHKRKFMQLYPNYDLCDKKTFGKLFPKEKIDLIKSKEDFVIGRIIKLLETGES